MVLKSKTPWHEGSTHLEISLLKVVQQLAVQALQLRLLARPPGLAVERRLCVIELHDTKCHSGSILLKNSVGEVERAALRRSTSQIDPGSTIETSARVE